MSTQQNPNFHGQVAIIPSLDALEHWVKEHVKNEVIIIPGQHSNAFEIILHGALKINGTYTTGIGGAITGLETISAYLLIPGGLFPVPVKLGSASGNPDELKINVNVCSGIVAKGVLDFYRKAEEIRAHIDLVTFFAKWNEDAKIWPL